MKERGKQGVILLLQIIDKTEGIHWGRGIKAIQAQQEAIGQETTANKVPTATAKAHHEVYNLKSRYIAVKIVIFCLFSVSLPDFHHQTNSLFSQWIFFSYLLACNTNSSLGWLLYWLANYRILQLHKTKVIFLNYAFTNC